MNRVWIQTNTLVLVRIFTIFKYILNMYTVLRVVDSFDVWSGMLIRPSLLFYLIMFSLLFYLKLITKLITSVGLSCLFLLGFSWFAHFMHVDILYIHTHAHMYIDTHLWNCFFFLYILTRYYLEMLVYWHVLDYF